MVRGVGLGFIPYGVDSHVQVDIIEEGIVAVPTFHTAYELSKE